MNYDAIDAGAKQVVEIEFRKPGNLAKTKDYSHSS